MHRAPFLVWLSVGVMLPLAAASAQTSSTRPRANALEASLPQVHIAPAGQPASSSSIETGSNLWAAKGYDLRSLVAQIYNVDARRIDFGGEAALASQRFDVSVSLPVEVDEDTMQRLLADAVEQRFGLKIEAQSRAMYVYVLTAPNGPGAAMKRHPARMSAAEVAGVGSDVADGGSRVTVFGQNCTDKGTNNGIEAEASTIADFRRSLEPDLDRVLVDETHLAGSFDFTVSKYTSQQDLFRLLRDQLGLVVTPAERKVTVLAVRPAGPTGTQSLQAQVAQPRL